MKEIKNVKDGKYTSPLTGRQIPATANPNAVYAGRDVRVDVIKKTVTFIESGKTVPLADAIANLKFPEFDESGKVDKNSLKEGFEWWHPLVSLAGGVGLALLPIFAVLGPGMILHPNALVPGDSWADVYRHYKKKFRDKRIAKKLTNEDVLEFIKFIEDNVSELPSGVQKWMKGLINKLKTEMNKDEEELDKNKLLVLMRDVENYAKRKGVKIDNLIQIAHNVDIGDNTVIAAQTGIAGSTKIGKNSMIGGQVGIVGHIQIADGVKIAAQSGIGNSISNENEIVQGSPAFSIGDYKRCYVLFRSLPKLKEQLDSVQKEIKDIKNE